VLAPLAEDRRQKSENRSQRTEDRQRIKSRSRIKSRKRIKSKNRIKKRKTGRCGPSRSLALALNPLPNLPPALTLALLLPPALCPLPSALCLLSSLL
jgi:hypothetical protein